MDIATTFNKHYKMACYSDHPATGTIRVPTRQKALLCEFEVIATLKALLKTGVTPNEDLANTCRDFFLRILHSDTRFITKACALDALVAENNEGDILYREISHILGG